MTPAEFHSSRKFADTRYGRIAYVERGAGPIALFLHGLPLNGYEWRDVIAESSRERRCLAPDMMGLGYTEVAAGQGVSFPEQAKMIAAFLDALGVDQVDLVGNDTGAGVSQLVTAHFPERVRSLTLTNCEVFDLWPNQLLAGFYEGVRAGAVVEGMKQMLGDLKLAREQLAALVYENVETFTAETVMIYLGPVVGSPERAALFQKLADWRPSRDAIVAAAPKLAASKVPAQIVWGDADVVFDTRPSLEWLGANLGGLRKTTIVPGGKLFFPEEHPQRLAALLAEFWRSVG
jgi:pimeloyl-ACP methyl ester carboxylesterase